MKWNIMHLRSSPEYSKLTFSIILFVLIPELWEKESIIPQPFQIH
jgi:hypothetical protein